MTRDDIIRMAREAGLTYAPQTGWWVVGPVQRLEAFAALVAAHERGQMSRRKQARRIAELEAEVGRWMAVAEALQAEVTRAKANPWPTTGVMVIA